MPGSLGLPSGTVIVVPHDPAWAELYAREVARLEAVLSAEAVTLRLEHTGSTAVPGLAAKPVIDILAGRAADGQRERVIGALERAGYAHRGEQGIPGRDFFRRGDPRQYHLHLTEVGSAFWRDHLCFRDHLRAHPEAAAAYAALKLELAARHPRDREAYIAGKTPFVQAILASANDTAARDREAVPMVLPVPVTLRTARLLMRPWAAADAEALLPILEANLARLAPWIPARVATPVPLPELAERLAGYAADFAACRAWRYALVGPDGALLGEADLFPRDATGRVPLDAADRVELGYWLADHATGQGLATEAVRALMDVAATLPAISRAEIRCDAANAPSAAIPSRLGFALAGLDDGMQLWHTPLPIR